MDTIDIYRESLRHFLRPILPLLEDASVSEILVNGHDVVYVERAGRLQLSEYRFPDAASLSAAVRNIAEYVNRRIDAEHHSMDARLPDGSRVHVIIPPSSRHGAHISIRKFLPFSFRLSTLVEQGSISAEAAEFLQMIVLIRKNTVVAGGTGTGKTSILNALSASIPDRERVIVIEESSELQLKQPHTVYLEAQPPRPDGRGEVTIRDLFVDSLRMRPDRIVIGEVRRGEALDVVQAMISGHVGSLTTVHANTPLDAMIRLETLCLMAGVDLPVYVARRQVASAVNVVVQLARFDDGSRRVFQISEVTGLDSAGSYTSQDLYKFQSRGRDGKGNILGSLEPTGLRPTFAAEPFEFGFGDRVQLTSNLFVAPDAK